jgi:recombination protein RecR
MLEPTNNASLIEQLIQALRILPSVGPRSATRMAYHLLHAERHKAKLLAQLILDNLTHVQNCNKCNTFCDQPICHICQNNKRDTSKLCIVEMPIDVHMLEQTQSYQGLYFVLMGKLSPLDGIGIKDIAFEKMLARACESDVKEVILATSFSAEGETTAFYIADILNKKGIHVSRLARGVPAGSELEYVDVNTIARALIDRRNM